MRWYLGLSLRGLLRVGLLGLALLGGGCTRWARLAVAPGGCVNPASGSCPSSGQARDSRILEVRFYQLKEQILVCKLDLNAFLDGKDVDVLKAVLSDPQRLDIVRKIEFFEQSKSRLIAPIEILPSTQYVLAVAMGLRRSKNSLRLIPAPALSDETPLFIRGTDLCLFRPCEINIETECP